MWYWGLSTSGLCLLGAGSCPGLISLSHPLSSVAFLPRRQVCGRVGAFSLPAQEVFSGSRVSRAHCCHAGRQAVCISAKFGSFQGFWLMLCSLPWKNRRKHACFTKGILCGTDVFLFFQSFFFSSIPIILVCWGVLLLSHAAAYLHVRQRWELLIFRAHS